MRWFIVWRSLILDPCTKLQTSWRSSTNSRRSTGYNTLGRMTFEVIYKIKENILLQIRCWCLLKVWRLRRSTGFNTIGRMTFKVVYKLKENILLQTPGIWCLLKVWRLRRSTGFNTIGRMTFKVIYKLKENILLQIRYWCLADH